MKISVTIAGIDERAARRMRDALSDAVLRRARLRLGEGANRRRIGREPQHISTPDGGNKGGET